MNKFSVLAFFLTISFIAILIPINHVNSGTGIIVQATVIPSTPQPIPTNTSSLYPPTLTYDQALETYGRFSTEVVKTSNDTVELAKGILTFLAGLGGIATIIVSFIAFQTRLAQSSSKNSAESAERSANEAQESRRHLERLQEQIRDSTQQLQEAKNELQTLRKQMKYLQSSKMDQLEALAYIQDHVIKLFDEDDVQNQLALTALIEYSRDKNPVIQLECITAFNTLIDLLEDKNLIEQIITRLKEIAVGDAERAVRIMAQRTLKQLDSN